MGGPLTATMRAPASRVALNSWQRFQHGHDVLPRHARAGAAADRKDDAFALGAFQDVECRLADFLGRAADADFERVHVAHEAHAVAHALLHLADVLLLAPIQHVEAASGRWSRQASTSASLW